MIIAWPRLPSSGLNNATVPLSWPLQRYHVSAVQVQKLWVYSTREGVLLPPHEHFYRWHGIALSGVLMAEDDLRNADRIWTKHWMMPIQLIDTVTLCRWCQAVGRGGWSETVGTGLVTFHFPMSMPHWPQTRPGHWSVLTGGHHDIRSSHHVITLKKNALP